MKNHFIYFLCVIGYAITIGQTSTLASEADTCSPVFKEVYDFQG